MVALSGPPQPAPDHRAGSAPGQYSHPSGPVLPSPPDRQPGSAPRLAAPEHPPAGHYAAGSAWNGEGDYAATTQDTAPYPAPVPYRPAPASATSEPSNNKSWA